MKVGSTTCRSAIAVVATLATALGFVAGPVASPSVKPQRVILNVTIKPSFTPVGKAQLTAVTAGSIGPDRGTLTFVDQPDTTGVRDGQSFTRFRDTATFTGKKGALVLAEDTYGVSAGIGVDVVTGTWRVLRGTGAYRGVTGKGRSAAVFGLPAPIDPYPLRYEGLITTP